MRTYNSIFTEGMTVKFSKNIKEEIHKRAIEANISQGEFVRDAVAHYINYLNIEVTKPEIVTINIETYRLIIQVLNHLWKYGVKEDTDNEISNLVFVLLTEYLFDIDNKIRTNESTTTN